MASNLFSDAENDLEVFAGKRLPILLCLDTSGSMGHYIGSSSTKTKIEALNEGLHDFYRKLQEDEITRYTAEVAIVTFGGNRSTGKPIDVKKVCDFSRVEIQQNPPVLTAYGYTPIGEAINLGLALLEKRKKQYKAYGNTYYRPWIVIMSDGYPDGGSKTELETAKATIREYSLKKKVVPISVAIGRQNNDTRKLLSELGNGLVIPMDINKFPEFFVWLHNSVSSSVEQGVDTIIEQLLRNAKTWSDEDFFRNI
ncbi:MAG: VWA domain-containing protein [Ruminococcus sp.]|nr:VWA domain-containing protein [Ruminococcus sp.]